MSRELSVILTSILPISELRGAIPLGLSFGFSIYKSFLLSIIGNLIPIVPLLFLLEPISCKLKKFYLWKKFFDNLEERTRKKAKIVEKYETLGLTIFVAVPLPMTGAWTGAFAATLFGIRFRYALLAISLGVIAAGIIVSLVSLGVINIFKSF